MTACSPFVSEFVTISEIATQSNGVELFYCHSLIPNYEQDLFVELGGCTRCDG